MDSIDLIIADNAQTDWLLALAVAAGTVLVLRLFKALARHRLASLAAKTATEWDDIAVRMIGDTRLLFLFLVSLFAGALALKLPAVVTNGLQVVLIIALLVQGGIWAGVMVQALVESHRKRAQQVNPGAVTSITLIGFAARIVLWSTVVLLILDNLNINVTALLAGLGIGGVAVALAVQNILGDLFASLSIVLDKPFVVGDLLTVGEFQGNVERIGLKTTRLRSLSGEQVVFSNADLLGSRVRNFGRMFERRVVFTVGVPYETKREKLRRIPGIIRAAVEAQQTTRFERSHFMQYAPYSLNFETVYFVLTSDVNIHMDVLQAILLRIHEDFEHEKIGFAYPTQRFLLDKTDTGPENPSILRPG